jgi:hypothetical protein
VIVGRRRRFAGGPTPFPIQRKEMQMKTVLRNALCVMSFAAAATAYAGARFTYPVVINDLNRTAYGALTDARGSADTRQYIGCWSNNASGGCDAVNASGLTRSCSTIDPAMLAVIRSMSDESYVAFRWGADGSTCQYIYAQTTSYSKPAAVAGP